MCIDIIKMVEDPLMLFIFWIFNPNPFGVVMIESMEKNVGLRYQRHVINKSAFSFFFKKSSYTILI